MNIRIAEHRDIDDVLAIMDMARRYQRTIGFSQWVDGYPNREIINADIESGNAFVFIIENRVVGYVVLQIGDNAYDMLTDTWQYEGSYGVAHRLAFDDLIRGKGYSQIAFQLIESNFMNRGVMSLRIDTGEQNVVMHHILDRAGYTNLGVKLFPWGRRVAYEKKILLNYD